MFNRKPNFQNQLAAALEQNPVWRDLAQVTTQVINEVISEPRWALSRVRQSEVVQRGDWMDTPAGPGRATLIRRVRSNIDLNANTYDFQDFVEVELNGNSFATLPVRVLQDREVLVANARNLGFNYFSSSLQDDDYARIVDYVQQFWTNAAGSTFMDFISMIKRTKFDISQLWTQAIGDPGQPSFGTTPANDLDYYADFFPESTYLTKMWERLDFNPLLTVDQPLTGSYYPTSHVEVGWDMLEHPVVDTADLVSLFYLLAPIHLVLQRFSQVVYVNIDYQASLGPMLYTIQERSTEIVLHGPISVESDAINMPAFKTQADLKLHASSQGSAQMPTFGTQGTVYGPLDTTITSTFPAFGATGQVTDD